MTAVPSCRHRGWPPPAERGWQAQEPRAYRTTVLAPVGAIPDVPERATKRRNDVSPRCRTSTRWRVVPKDVTES